MRLSDFANNSYRIAFGGFAAVAVCRLLTSDPVVDMMLIATGALWFITLILRAVLMLRAGPKEAERVKENWHVTGRGGQRGSDWTERRRWGGRGQRGDHDWFGGFLSGMSLERNENLLRNHTFEEAVTWLDERCEAFPADQICYSAAKVAAKLMWPDTDVMSP